jgi:translation elongation factor EF-Ts
MSQTYVSDEDKIVADFVKENIAKTGENLIIRQFKRIELGVVE